MSTILTIIYAVLIFSLIIFVHEFGHFITAKLFGVYVMEFSIGMGPAIFKKQRGETLYAIRAIPIGGFCAMEGENGESDNPRSFGRKSKLQRFIILASGAAMNLILGFFVMLAFLGIYSHNGFVTTTVSEVAQEMPAAEAGVMPGDKLISVNGYRVHVKSEIDIYGGFEKSYNIKVKRTENGKTEKLSFNITPREVEQEIDGQQYKRKMVGLSFKTVDKSFGTLIKYTYYNSVFMGKLVLISLKQLLTGAVSASNLSGPVGIISGINSAAKSGFADILYLMALITINLGLFNLLPLPALDGGRIFFIIIEAIIRKPVSAKYEGIVHAIGFALLILLMLYATGNDILRLIKG